MSYQDLEEDEKLIWEWQYRMLGGFQEALMEAIARADPTNLYRLHLGFPFEVDAFTSFAGIPGWWEKVQEKGLRRE